MAIAPKGKKVTGTKKADKITWTSSAPWKKALTVNAGAGNDVINFKKSNYKNTIKGENGNDKIYGGKKVDKIYGGNGNDKLYGYAGNDIIKGDAGKDSIYGGDGNDKIWGGKGNDVINGGKGTNIIYFANGDGTDTIVKGGGSDTLKFTNIKNLETLKEHLSTIKEGNNLVLYYGASESDRVIVKDFFTTTSSVKKLMANDGKAITVDALLNERTFWLSGQGNIGGTKYKDDIYGSSGNDTISSGAGDDTIYGGEGDDVINAGAGNNVIRFGADEGTNTIISGGGTDTLVFTDETDIADFTFAYNGNNLNITAGETTAQLQNFLNGEKSVKYLVVGSQTYDISNVTISGKATIDGTAGNDFIIGTGTSPQTIHTGAGNDIVYATNDASSTIYCDGGNNTIIAGADKFATIYLGEGNDTIYTSSDNDTGNNIFINNSIIDGGHDTIYWQGAANTNIRLNKTLYDDVALTQDGTDVILRYGNDNTVTVKDYNSISPNVGFSFYNVTNFKRKNALITEKGIKEYIEGSGTIAGTSANEYIKGSDGADSLTSNGDDVLNGGAGNDTYYVSSLTDSTAIIDSAGSDILNSDILNIAASKSDIKILFNVNSDGSFDSVYDKLYLVDSDTFDACIDSHSMPTSGIKISDFDSIETINATDGQIANLSQLKSDVANWLTDDGRSYGSVAAALEDENADLSTLIAIFDRAANWQ